MLLSRQANLLFFFYSFNHKLGNFSLFLGHNNVLKIIPKLLLLLCGQFWAAKIQNQNWASSKQYMYLLFFIQLSPKLPQYFLLFARSQLSFSLPCPQVVAKINSTILVHIVTWVEVERSLCWLQTIKWDDLKTLSLVVIQAIKVILCKTLTYYNLYRICMQGIYSSPVNIWNAIKIMQNIK